MGDKPYEKPILRPYFQTTPRKYPEKWPCYRCTNESTIVVDELQMCTPHMHEYLAEQGTSLAKLIAPKGVEAKRLEESASRDSDLDPADIDRGDRFCATCQAREFLPDAGVGWFTMGCEGEGHDLREVFGESGGIPVVSDVTVHSPHPDQILTMGEFPDPSADTSAPWADGFTDVEWDTDPRPLIVPNLDADDLERLYSSGTYQVEVSIYTATGQTLRASEMVNPPDDLTPEKRRKWLNQRLKEVADNLLVGDDATA